MDIKSVNSGNGRLDKVQSESLQRKADDAKAQANANANKQIQDKLELSSEATRKSQAALAFNAENKNIEQRLKKYDRPEVYRDVAQKLNKLYPAAVKKA